MKFKANQLEFPSTSGDFVSPFFSPESLKNIRIQESIRAVGPGLMASLGAKAFQDATMRATKRILLSDEAGGMPVEVVTQLIDSSGGLAVQNGLLKVEGELDAGLFVSAVFPNTTSADRLRNAAVEVGLNIAINAISAVPIVGPIFKAVVAVAQGLAKIFKRPSVQIDRSTPWQEYSQSTDNDIINKFIIGIITPSVDWTNFFRPPMPSGPFTISHAEGEGDRYVVGVFKIGAAGRYIPDYFGNRWGYMPGTQQMIDVVQLANLYVHGPTRYDAITNVGDFYPATTQWGTVAWGMVQASSNEGTGADLYKIQASRLLDEWENYWGSYFDDLFNVRSEGAGLLFTEKATLFAKKAILRYLYTENQITGEPLGVDQNNLANWGSGLLSWVNSDLLTPSNATGNQWMRPDQALTTPALNLIRARQLEALSNSLSCAYVRWKEVGNRPAFAAFRDPGPATKSGFDNFGHQLREKCKEMRQVLLTHPARWKVNYWDVLAVDPEFAEQLKDAQAGGPPLSLAALPSQVDPDAPPSSPAQEPQGGLPFGEFATPPGTSKPQEWSTTKKIFVGAAIAGAGYLGYKAYKGEMGEVTNAVKDLVEKVKP